LDASFGTAGFILTSAIGIATAIAVQADGKILVGGDTVTALSTHGDFAIARYGPEGTLDDAFGANGRVVTDFSSGSERVSALRIQPDGNIVAAGVTFPPGRRPFSFLPTNVALARYDAAGVMDATFGTAGRVVTDVNGGADEAAAVLLQADGKIAVAGTADKQFLVARYDRDGTSDLGFGGCGRVITDFPGERFDEDHAYTLVAQPDGKLVAAGTTYDGGIGGFALARYQGTGASTCPARPNVNCTSPSGLSRSSVELKKGVSDARDQIAWRLNRGGTTSIEDFGDPLTTDTYSVCMYDESSAAARLVFAATAPANAQCGPAVCWKRTHDAGFSYVDPRGAACGLEQIRVRASARGDTRVAVRGKGAGLVFPRLPVGIPFRVQLNLANGHCWETVLSHVSRSDSTIFRAQ